VLNLLILVSRKCRYTAGHMQFENSIISYVSIVSKKKDCNEQQLQKV
jgi:hypothetical protein